MKYFAIFCLINYSICLGISVYNHDFFSGAGWFCAIVWVMNNLVDSILK